MGPRWPLQKRPWGVLQAARRPSKCGLWWWKSQKMFLLEVLLHINSFKVLYNFTIAVKNRTLET
jgi:hypothetical protein